jgi:hypothetical protein
MRPIHGSAPRRWVRGWAAAAMLVLSGCAPAIHPGTPGRVQGMPVQVVTHLGESYRGELLAADSVRLWIVDPSLGRKSLELGTVRDVRFQRHAWSRGSIIGWSATAGGATSLMMFGACMSVDGDDGASCGAFTAGWALAWVGVTAFGMRLIRPTEVIRPHRFAELPAYARFPQGLPPGFEGAGRRAEPLHVR